MSEEHSGVHLCGPTNSTIFTNCCGVAIHDWQEKCPSCGASVRGAVAHGQSGERWEMAYGPWRKYGGRRR